MERKSNRTTSFAWLGRGLWRHTRRSGFLDRIRRVPEITDEGDPTPAHRRFEAMTHATLRQRGQDFYRDVRAIYDPRVAAARAAVNSAELRVLATETASAEAASRSAGVSASGPANDPGFSIRRAAKAQQAKHAQSLAALDAARETLASVIAERHAAILEAQERGWEHHALGGAIVEGYWEWLLRFRRKGSVPRPMSAEIEAPAWMTELDEPGVLSAAEDLQNDNS